jgi:hypothetical protein
MDELISEYGGAIMYIIMGAGIIRILSSALEILQNMG